MQGTLKSQTILKKNEVGRCVLPDFKTYYKAVIISIPWYWHEDRHMNQWNRMESTEINQYFYSQLIFNKGAQD